MKITNITTAQAQRLAVGSTIFYYLDKKYYKRNSKSTFTECLPRCGCNCECHEQGLESNYELTAAFHCLPCCEQNPIELYNVVKSL